MAKRYSPKLKFQIVLEALKGEQTIGQLAKAYGVHPNSIHVVNVGGCFPDGSWRLVRDLPVGSPTWKALYHQGRNAVEGRNATLEKWGLKRLPVYGLPRVTAWLFLADVWANLTTLARLIREATRASARS